MHIQADLLSSPSNDFTSQTQQQFHCNSQSIHLSVCTVFVRFYLMQKGRMFFRIGFALFVFSNSFLTISFASGQDKRRYRVLDMDGNGNLYLHKTSLLCASEIIKRLTEGTYKLVGSILGLSKELAVKDCQDLKLKVPSVQSGVYWIDPDGGSHGNAFQAYCDQQTVGGGWTLVWSYTFTDYPNFNNGANAVTPRPTWTASSANTRVSTTVPLSETHYEAMNFASWRTIGKEFLIKSNINNWIACKEGTGSIVQLKAGSITCKLVKQISEQCAGIVPNSLTLHPNGPYLFRSNLYYYFDSNTSGSWPTHDPCGTDKPNQLKGVANPHGNIFVR